MCYKHYIMNYVLQKHGVVSLTTFKTKSTGSIPKFSIYCFSSSKIVNDPNDNQLDNNINTKEVLALNVLKNVRLKLGKTCSSRM